MQTSQPLTHNPGRRPGRRYLLALVLVIVLAVTITGLAVALTRDGDAAPTASPSLTPTLTIEEFLAERTGMPEDIAGRSEIYRAEATAAAAGQMSPEDELRAALQPFFNSASFHVEGNYFDPYRTVELGTLTDDEGREIPFSLGGGFVEISGDYVSPDSFRLTRNITSKTVFLPDGATPDIATIYVPAETVVSVVRNGIVETPDTLTLSSAVAQMAGAENPDLFLVEFLTQSLRGQGTPITAEQFLDFESVTRLGRVGRGQSILQGYEANHPLLVSRATWEFWFDADTEQLTMVRFVPARGIGPDAGPGIRPHGEITLSRHNLPIPGFP